MNRSSIWFAVVVALATAAAILAYIVAAPGPDATRDGVRSGFEQLRPTLLASDAREWSNAYRERHLQRVTLLRASASARSWLTNIAGSRTDPSRLPRQIAHARTGAGVGRIAAFVTWADDLPQAVWSVGAPQVRLAGDRQTGAVIARSIVTVRMLQAAKVHRDTHIAATLVLRPVGATATSAATSWVLDDIRLPEATGLRTIRDPVIVHRPHVDLYSDRAHVDAAVRLADHAEAAMPTLLERYPGLSSSDVVGIYLLDNDQQARTVLGDEANSSDRTIGRALAWTYEGGDVVLDWSKLAFELPRSRQGTLRHELTHVVTRTAITSVPTLLMEGIAVREETHFVTDGTTLRPDFSMLHRAIAARTLNYQQLLHSSDSSFGLSSSDDIDIAYQAASATVAYIEATYGHAALVRLLQRTKADAGIDGALAKELLVGPAEFERRLLIWIGRNLDGT